ncbi:MAG: hypothetical protein ABL994_21500, partial [Verrucomicrobiales bacterium]
MKPRARILLIGIASLNMGIGALIADPAAPALDPKNVVIADPGKAVVIPDNPSSWFFSGGAAVRTVDAGFGLNGGAANFPGQTGLGNVGLYQGGPGRITYDDGFVGQHETRVFRPGAAGGFVQSSSQISTHPVGLIANGNRNLVLDFHTEGYSYLNQGARVDVSDSDSGVGPYLQFGRHLAGITRFNV